MAGQDDVSGLPGERGLRRYGPRRARARPGTLPRRQLPPGRYAGSRFPPIARPSTTTGVGAPSDLITLQPPVFDRRVRLRVDDNVGGVTKPEEADRERTQATSRTPRRTGVMACLSLRRHQGTLSRRGTSIPLCIVGSSHGHGPAPLAEQHQTNGQAAGGKTAQNKTTQGQTARRLRQSPGSLRIAPGALSADRHYRLTGQRPYVPVISCDSGRPHDRRDGTLLLVWRDRHDRGRGSPAHRRRSRQRQSRAPARGPPS